MNNQTQLVYKPSSILVIGLGGTISLALENGRAVSTNNLASMVARFGADVQLETYSLRTKDSADVTVHDLIETARTIQSQAAEFDGFIVTTGTDTLEEVTYGLHCLIGRSAKVVVTGAMRPPYMDDYDGVANLTDAVTVCQSVSVGHGGVVAVIGKQLFLAEHVVKGNATRLDGFLSTSPEHTAQSVAEGMVVKAEPKTNAKNLGDLGPTPTVDLISASLECRWHCDPNHLPDGLIIACPGAHSAPASLLEDLSPLLAAGRPVVLASRCVSFMPSPTAFYPGYAEHLEARGLQITDYAGLTPQKARLKLIFRLMGLAV
jgi:L-asparaginase